jgi:hypothetical protein
MKKRVKILKHVPSYVIGKEYRVSGSFASRLFARGQAEEVKEEKAIIKTKEEKFKHETKAVLSISKLKEVISDLSAEELIHIANFDSRISAIKLAKKELNKR